jgi:hypothetical protein
MCLQVLPTANQGNTAEAKQIRSSNSASGGQNHIQRSLLDSDATKGARVCQPVQLEELASSINYLHSATTGTLHMP